MSLFVKDSRCACVVLLHITTDYVAAVAGGTSGLTCMVTIP